MDDSRQALELCWVEHRRFVAAVLAAHVPAEVDLEDLVQEVALKFCEHFGELRDAGRIRPWLRALAVNTARSAGRREQVRRRSLRPLRHEPESPVEPGAAGDSAQRALAIARSLHPDYREPLLLKCVRGLTQRQIAAALELPETTIETRLARARRMLRDELRRQEELPRIAVRGQTP